MDGSDRRAFAELLRRLRHEAGLTQQQLAERAGISVRSISDLERAISERPRRDTTAMLAAALGLAGPEREAFIEAARRRPRLSTTPIPYPAPPQPATPLLGRASELAAIEHAIIGKGVRLLTLTGPGGVGKTRLAIEVAHELGDRFADGVVFVRLEGLNDPALVLPTLAGALSLLEIGGERSLVDRLAAHLRTRDLLVVLDNMEHLVTAASDIADLIGRAPEARILTTSREPLRIGGEHVIAVAPLPRPDPATWRPSSAEDSGFPAVDLFVQRALAVRPDLALDTATEAGAANLAAIAEICHRLDGLPLAIELVAAQAQVLSPATILSLLQSAAPPLFATGVRDHPARFQTMSAAIAWSYDLLSAAEQALFRALSVFAAGFTLPAAAAVSRAIGYGPSKPFDPERPLAGIDPELVAAIASLARKSLLFEDTAANDGAPRFRMLEPIRLFALDCLRQAGEERVIRLRHAVFFADLAAMLDVLSLGPDPEIWLRQQTLEFDNFRGALDWALEAGEFDLAVRMTGSIAQYWEIKGLISEATRRVSRAIAVDAASPPASRWFLRFWEATFALDRGDVAAAMGSARKLLEIAEANDDPIGIGAGQAALSRAVGAYPDRHDEAAELARSAVEVLEPLEQDEWTGWAWGRLGIEYHRLGRLEESRDCLRKSLEIRQRRPCEGCTAYTLVSLGAVSLDLGEPEAALDALRQSLALAIKHENQALLLAALLGLADLAWRFASCSEPERAALLFFGAAEAQRRRHALGRRPGAEEAITRWQSPMRSLRGDETVEALIAEGMILSLDDVSALARDLRVAAGGASEVERARGGSLLAAFGSIE